MNERLTEPEIKTLENQIMEKNTEVDEAITEETMFEKAKRLYLEMKALSERLSMHLNNQSSMSNQHNRSDDANRQPRVQ